MTETGAPEHVLRVAYSAWFAGRPVGSGQVTDELARALRAAYPADDLAVVQGGHGGAVAKLRFEQWSFPRAARGASVAHVPYWAPPWRCPAPVVVTVHDAIPAALAAYRGGPRQRAYTRLVSAATRRAAAVIADSRHTASDVVRHLRVRPARVTVVPLGVSARFAAATRQAYPGLPERFALYLGGYDRRKNLATLLAAWGAVHAATGVPLVLAGDPASAVEEDARAAEALVRAGAARRLGHVPENEKPALYAAATVFAYPSTYEGFGLPPLEAMATGTPVVASDATSIPEVVGAAGLLVPPLDVAAWTEALARVLTDPGVAHDLGSRGAERARLFTWERTARGTHAVYEAVCEAVVAEARR